MGFCMDDVGKIGIEDCGKSFRIHVGYGLRRELTRVGDLRPGDEFLAHDPRKPWEPGGMGLPNQRPPRNIWRVKAVYEDRVEAAEQQFSTLADFLVDLEVETVDAAEVFDASLPLSNWNAPDCSWPHPELLSEDLDDLITALKRLRRRRTRV